MFDVVTGPFHPDLESALVEQVRQLKSNDPLTPLAIVVPSDLLKRRVQWLLCVEHQSALIDLHFLTFHQLALRLYDEQQVLVNSKDRSSIVEFVHDLFFEYLLSQLASRESTSMDSTTYSDFLPGSWTALWATIRDLKEAMVDPMVALQGVSEGLFDPEDTPKLRTLFMLYAAVQKTSRALGVGTFNDLASKIISWVPHSRFLPRLRGVCYYGFYDLTQVQLSLFEAVSRVAPVTLYFPLSNTSEFGFARRFYERHLSRDISSIRVSHSKRSESDSKATQNSQLHVQIVNAAGTEDELIFVCKEILRVVESHGYRFDEVGVVARTLEPYRRALRRTFDQNWVPFTTTAMSPVLQEPVVKSVLQLAQLSLNNFYWRTVLDVVTSPFYRVERYGKTRDQVRPDLWELAVRTLGITRGEEEWRRFTSISKLDSFSICSEEMEIDAVSDCDQLRFFQQLVAELIADCQALPDHGNFHELTDAFTELIEKHLAIPGLVSESGRISPEVNDNLVPYGQTIKNSLVELRQLSRISGEINWEECIRVFVRAVKRTTVAIGTDNYAGVRVLDAMSARGLSFRVLFVLGLNEKVFPRVIREDAFLRDRHRRVLAETLGYKIDEKLTGHEEEQLLFALLKQAARDRLFLLCQRADTEGRPLAPSSYLSEFQQDHSLVEKKREICMPRRFADRANIPQFAPSLLTDKERAQSLVLQGYDPSPTFEDMKCGAELFRNGWETLQLIEGREQQLGACDGLTGSNDDFWNRMLARGISPTPLEQYARCPFQYFAGQVLGLTSLRQQETGELPAQAVGKLCHAVLGAGYQRLIKVGWPERELSPDSIRHQILSAAEAVFNTYSVEHGTGYFLTWQLTKEVVVELVIASVESDQEDYRKSGFRPIAFEVAVEGILENVTRSEEGSLKIKGRLDRIDRRVSPPGHRIVDYKFQQGRKMKNQDQDLLTSGVRGFRLQPPLYSLMTRLSSTPNQMEFHTEQLHPEQVEFMFLAPYWENRVDRSRFDAMAWEGDVGRQLRHTFEVLLDGIKAGRYFIVPDNYCDFCEYSTVCRRFHGPTWRRVHQFPPAKLLRNLRKAKVASG